MKRFLKHILSYSIITILVFIVLGCIPYFFHSKLKRHYNYQYIKTFEKIKKTKGDKRLILVGGSNLAFGIDSKQISKSLNISTINFGIHGGIGIKRPLSDLKNLITNKDVLVLVPEFVNYDINRYGQELYMIEYMYSKNLIGILRISFEDYIKSIKFIYPRMIKYILFDFFQDDTIINRGYKIEQFNNYGDYIIDQEEKKKVEFKYQINDDKSTLTELKAYLDNNIKNLQYFIIPPPTVKSYFEKGRLIKYNQAMNNIFASNFLCCLETFSFEEEYFLDTNYHLTQPGKAIRTNKIIKLLEQNLMDETKRSDWGH